MNNRNINLEFLLRVLHLTATIDNTDCIWWRTDGNYSPVSIFVNCHGQFEAGLADCEELTPQNIHLLEEAITEVGPTEPSLYVPMLFCAKVRKKCPRIEMYQNSPSLREVFERCGPSPSGILEVGGNAINALGSAVACVEEEINIFADEPIKPTMNWWERFWNFIKKLIEKISKRISK